MPITFGSFGDIVSLCHLINSLVTSLDKSRGSSAKYQTLIHDLDTLNHILSEVDAFFGSCEYASQLTPLISKVCECVESCRQHIDTFCQRAQRYEKTLGGGGSGSIIKDTASKFRWQMLEQEHLVRFRARMKASCIFLNTLLGTANVIIARLDGQIVQQRLGHAERMIGRSSAKQTSLLVGVKDRLEDSYAQLKAATAEIRDLVSRPRMGYFCRLAFRILTFLRKIWSLNLSTHNMIKEIYDVAVILQAHIPIQVDRRWLLDVVTFEDALGREAWFRLECINSWRAFDTALEDRFEMRPGYRKIKRREYVLRVSATKKDIDRSVAFDSCFVPGLRVDMSMVFDSDSTDLTSCPGCKLDISKDQEELVSQVQCPGCKLWYQCKFETETKISDMVRDSEPAAFTGINIAAPDTQPSKMRRFLEKEDVLPKGGQREDNPSQFCRVRLRCWRQSQNPDNITCLSTPHVPPTEPAIAPKSAHPCQTDSMLEWLNENQQLFPETPSLSTKGEVVVVQPEQIGVDLPTPCSPPFHDISPSARHGHHVDLAELREATKALDEDTGDKEYPEKQTSVRPAASPENTTNECFDGGKGEKTPRCRSNRNKPRPNTSQTQVAATSVSISTSRHCHRLTRPTKPALLAYLESDEDPLQLGLLRMTLMASRSPLPNQAQYMVRDYYGEPEQSLRTSMLPERSDYDHNNSLAGLTDDTDGTVESFESVNSSMGEGAFDQSTQFLGSNVLFGEAAKSASLQQRNTFECPFKALGCSQEFDLDHEQYLFTHSLIHFQKDGQSRTQVDPPMYNMCCFCDETFEAESGMASWQDRMTHVTLHYRLGARLKWARQDLGLAEYLRHNGLLSPAEYQLFVAMPRKDAIVATPLPDSPYVSPWADAVAVTNDTRHRDGG